MIVAILLGPVLAVLVTRYVDQKRNLRERQMYVFRTLMKTRRLNTSTDHVGALNLVEIEFYGINAVIDPYKDLIRHFAAQHARKIEEQSGPNLSKDEQRFADLKFNDRINDERNKLLTKLLHAIGRELGFNIEQLEIFEGGYTPQGWVDVDTEQRLIRRYLIDLYAGRRVVPVGVVDFRSGTGSDGHSAEGSGGEDQEKERGPLS